MAKVQFNCRLDKEIAKWIAERSEAQSKQQGKKVSQADIVKMLVLSSPFNATAKMLDVYIHGDGDGSAPELESIGLEPTRLAKKSARRELRPKGDKGR